MKSYKLYFFAGFIFCLLQVWLPGYFLTGDGPCHVYNAHMLHQFWINRDISFYDHYFIISHRLNPNWFTHVALALLLYVTKGAIAEKLLVTFYLILFLSGFYRLLKRINITGLPWLLVIFIFVFQRALAMGFYNFSISIALCFWLIEIWLSYLDQAKIKLLFWFFLLSLFTFFAHPFSLLFGCFTCFCLTLSHYFSAHEIEKSKIITFFKKILIFFICIGLPAFLFLHFTIKEGAGQFHLHGYQYRLRNLLDSDYLLNYSHAETIFTKASGIIFLILFTASLFFKYKNGFKIHRYDGFLASFLLAAIVYKFFPDNLFGGGGVVMRAQIFLFFFAVCCISYLLPAAKMKNITGLILFGIFAVLTVMRIYVLTAAANAVNDITSPAGHIRPYSVVFPIDLAPNGKYPDNKLISDDIYLFSHAVEYIGLKKPLIFLDNYEANTDYFPFSWTAQTNPYSFLGEDGALEGWPPHANINEYKQKSGVTVDYVLIWCYDPIYLRNEHFRKLYEEINKGYHVTYSSATNRTILMEKNN